MPRTRHPFRGTVCPNCGQDLYCRFDLAIHSMKLGALVPEEKRERWPAEPPALPEEMTGWVDSFDDPGLLDAVDRKVAQRKCEMRTEAVASGAWDPFGDIGETSRFPCPACHTPLQLTVSLRILEAVKFQVEGVSDSHQTKGLSPRQVEVVETCRRNGVLKALTDAIDFQFGDLPGKPKNLDRFFLNFLKDARRMSVPFGLKGELRKKFPGSRLLLWWGQYIGAITVDDAIYQFVPTSVLEEVSKQNPTMLRKTLGKHVQTQPDELSTWVKTRHGYVPSDSKVFLGVLRQRSVGDFDTT